MFTGKTLEFVLIHKLQYTLPPGIFVAAIQFMKRVIEDSSEVVPCGKLIASYNACGQWLQVSIWDAPNIAALLPLIEEMRGLGFNTEVIPAEKAEVAIPKWEKSNWELRK